MDDGIDLHEGIDIFEQSMAELICIYLPGILRRISHVKLLEKYQHTIDITHEFDEMERRQFLNSDYRQLMHLIRHDAYTQARIGRGVYYSIREGDVSEEQLDQFQELYLNVHEK